jgi:hypothetical protein
MNLPDIKKENNPSTLTSRLQQEVRKEFDKEFPCPVQGCDNNGTIVGRDRYGEWEQSQCQFCDANRLPAVGFHDQIVEKIVQRVGEEVVGKVYALVEKENIVTFPEDQPVLSLSWLKYLELRNFVDSLLSPSLKKEEHE